MNPSNEIDEKTSKLEKLGKDLAKNQYDFKVRGNTSIDYWEKRIQEFERYHKITIDYFMEAYSLMNLINKEQSGPFLLRISKLKQIGTKLVECMKTIKQNPSVMDLKDKQQSKWSLDQKEKLFNTNEECKNQEKHMNVFFKEFYEKNLKQKN